MSACFATSKGDQEMPHIGLCKAPLETFLLGLNAGSRINGKWVAYTFFLQLKPYAE